MVGSGEAEDGDGAGGGGAVSPHHGGAQQHPAIPGSATRSTKPCKVILAFYVDAAEKKTHKDCL